MIAYLKGKLITKSQNDVIIDVNGVGYLVGISTQTFSLLPPAGSDLKLYTHHHFTESDQRLFGFLQTSEKDLFEILITVKSVGPKLALTMLSGMSAEQIMEAIARQDTLSLSRIPGIGKKTAERIVLELKDKLASVSASSTDNEIGGSVTQMASEAIAALNALGFKKTDSERAVLGILRNNKSPQSVSDLVRETLKTLHK